MREERLRDIPLSCTGSMTARVHSHHRRSLHATETSTTCEGEKEGERHCHTVVRERCLRKRAQGRGRGHGGEGARGPDVGRGGEGGFRRAARWMEGDRGCSAVE